MQPFNLNAEEIAHIRDLRKLTTAQHTMLYGLTHTLAKQNAPAPASGNVTPFPIRHTATA